MAVTAQRRRSDGGSNGTATGAARSLAGIGAVMGAAMLAATVQHQRSNGTATAAVMTQQGGSDVQQCWQQWCSDGGSDFGSDGTATEAATAQQRRQ